MNTLRRVVRQAVIFTLLGATILGIGAFLLTFVGLKFDDGSLTENITGELTWGILGALSGFGIWCFYRIVRFAVMG